MADTDITQTAAKGLYTFTTFEKIEMRYGVIAASWDEAKDHMDNYNFIKMNNGDHYGGNYIGESEPRRAQLIRKQSCMGANFTMTMNKETMFGKSTDEIMFANVDHSQAIYIPEYDDYDMHQHDSNGDCIKIERLEINGLCEKCNRMMKEGWSMIPKREATHTWYGNALKTHPCGTKSVVFEHDTPEGEE